MRRLEGRSFKVQAYPSVLVRLESPGVCLAPKDCTNQEFTGLISGGGDSLAVLTALCRTCLFFLAPQSPLTETKLRSQSAERPPDQQILMKKHLN